MSKTKHKTLIIGGCGYIGSRLTQFLTSYGEDVSIVDTGWFGNPGEFHYNKLDFGNAKKPLLNKFKNIILLAGHSSVQMCENNFYSAWCNNVHNFVTLLDNLHYDQKLIYASSSSVYGKHSSGLACEDELLCAPLNPYDHTKQIIDKFIHDHVIPNHRAKVYGLRFGTVCGHSPNFRNDVMINAMIHSAQQSGKVSVFNGDTRRSILGLNDLMNVYWQLLTEDKPSAIYNIASFHSTSAQIGQGVADYLGIPCENTDPPKTGNEKLITKNYDFWVDTKAFSQDFNYDFKDNIDSIVTEIMANRHHAIASSRSSRVNYAIK